MSKFNKMAGVLICLSILFSTPTYAQSPAMGDPGIPALPAVVPVAPKTTKEIVVDFAKKYQVSSTEMLGVMQCESKGNQSAVGDSGHAFGVYQYHVPTFNSFEKRMGEDLDINSKYDQIKLTAWAFSKGYQSHWTCYRIMGYDA